MKIFEISNHLNLKVESGHDGLDNETNSGYVSDLLSDVIGKAEQGQVWITLQTHKNIVAVASLKDLSAIIVIGGNEPSKDAINQSNQEKIPILTSKESCFTIAGKLFDLFQNEKIQGRPTHS